ncbi:hypothetical protein [Caballeronia sp. J97]|uniref:hypothetical protein n=1 Tax=Caballeronia sp. J97 TaxID=2805429 RepID=UPI002AB258A5|nr:hypothetical protein [Caballeronia sp. J97]
MKKNFSGRMAAGVLAIAALGATSIVARAADVHVGVNIGIPAPVYVAPTPVYAPPPPPVVYQPAPMYAPPVVIGWHGNRYWDGRRYWSRYDWNRYHGHRPPPPPPRPHGPPPGHGNGHGNGHGGPHGHR